MKQETEKLIYSLQSGFISSRNSIEDGKDYLDMIVDALPAADKAPVLIAIGVLLNSIVGEVMATENKNLTKGQLLDERTAINAKITKLDIATNVIGKL